MGERKDIGDIYKDQYADLELPPNDDLWSAVEIRTEYLKFYKFTWNHFNIYYLGCIVIFSLLSLYSFTKVVLFDDALLESDLTGQRQLMNQAADSAGREVSSSFSAGSENNPSVKDKKKSEKSRDNTSLSEPGTVSQSADSLSRKDSVAKVIAPTTEKSNKDSVYKTIRKEPKRRTIYIEEQDTIVVVDTLKNDKSKRRKKR